MKITTKTTKAQLVTLTAELEQQTAELRERQAVLLGLLGLLTVAMLAF